MKEWRRKNKYKGVWREGQVGTESGGNRPVCKPLRLRARREPAGGVPGDIRAAIFFRGGEIREGVTAQNFGDRRTKTHRRDEQLKRPKGNTGTYSKGL